MKNSVAAKRGYRRPDRLVFRVTAPYHPCTELARIAGKLQKLIIGLEATERFLRMILILARPPAKVKQK